VTNPNHTEHAISEYERTLSAGVSLDIGCYLACHRTQQMCL